MGFKGSKKPACFTEKFHWEFDEKFYFSNAKVAVEVTNRNSKEKVKEKHGILGTAEFGLLEMAPKFSFYDYAFDLLNENGDICGSVSFRVRLINCSNYFGVLNGSAIPEYFSKEALCLAIKSDHKFDAMPHPSKGALEGRTVWVLTCPVDCVETIPVGTTMLTARNGDQLVRIPKPTLFLAMAGDEECMPGPDILTVEDVAEVLSATKNIPWRYTNRLMTDKQHTKRASKILAASSSKSFVLRIHRIQCSRLRHVEGRGRGKNDVFVKLKVGDLEDTRNQTEILINSGDSADFANLTFAIDLDEAVIRGTNFTSKQVARRCHQSHSLSHIKPQQYIHEPPSNNCTV